MEGAAAAVPSIFCSRAKEELFLRLRQMSEHDNMKYQYHRSIVMCSNHFGYSRLLPEEEDRIKRRGGDAKPGGR